MFAATDTSIPGHGAKMDAIYGAQRHFYDATRKYYLLGRDRLIDGLHLPKGGHVLEIGCGTARNLALIAKAWPQARLHGLDISAEMLKSAHKTLDRRGLDARLALGDATDFDAVKLFGRAGFDRIVFSYTLSMIPGWEQALAHASTLLAPGGQLHVVDFGQQRHLPLWVGQALRAWLARFHVSPRADLFAVGAQIGRHRGLLIETAQPFRDYARTMVLRA